MSHDVQGHPRQVIVKYSEKIWSTNSKSLQYSFLLSHEPYEKAKLYDIWRWAPQIRCPVCSWWKSRGQLLIAPERMKQLGQSRNDAQLWMKGNQHWVVIGRADDEASIFWSPHVKTWLNGKKTWNYGKDWRQKGLAKDKKASLTQWIWIWANSGR